MNFQDINFYFQSWANISISKSLSFCNREITFKDIDFFYLTFTYLAVIVTMSLYNFFDTCIIMILVTMCLIILYLSVGY